MKPKEIERAASAFGIKQEIVDKNAPGRYVSQDESWLHVRIPKQVHDWIKKMAQANERSESYIARTLLLDGVFMDTEDEPSELWSRLVMVAPDWQDVTEV